MKIVLNTTYGGFRIPGGLAEMIAQESPHLKDPYHAGIPKVDPYSNDIRVRTHHILVNYYTKTNPNMVFDIPDDIPLDNLILLDHDGKEMVIEKGHAWGCPYSPFQPLN